VHDAGLVHRVRKCRFDGAVEASEAIGAEKQDVVDAAVFEFGENLEPELRTLRFGDPEPEHVAAAVQAHAEHDVERALLHMAAVANADEERVDIHDRIHSIETALLPSAKLFEHVLRGLADQLVRHVRAVQLSQVRRNIARRHSARVESENLLVEALQPPLMLGDELRLEAAARARDDASSRLPEAGS
jgi:hypothetical protein